MSSRTSGLDPQHGRRFAEREVVDDAQGARELVDRADHRAEALAVAAHGGDRRRSACRCPTCRSRTAACADPAGATSRASRPTPRYVPRKVSVSSYSIGIDARDARSCGVASCTWAITTSSSGSAFQTHTSTRPAALRMRNGVAWLIAHAMKPLPGFGSAPSAVFAWPSSIRIAALRCRRPPNPSESVTATQRVASASACSRGMPPGYEVDGRTVAVGRSASGYSEGPRVQWDRTCTDLVRPAPAQR